MRVWPNFHIHIIFYLRITSDSSCVVVVSGGSGKMSRRTMEWAAKSDHLHGIPRKVVIAAVGSFAKTVSSLINTTSVHNADTLLRLVRSRPKGIPLITVSNHMSTLDDPAMWGFKGFPIFDTKLARWVLAAEDICFRNPLYSYVFRTGNFTFHICSLLLILFVMYT